jgi:hypothetical protein
MEAEETLLQFCIQPSGRYRVVLAHGEFDSHDEFDRDELRQAFRRLVDELDNALQKRGLQISALI